MAEQRKVPTWSQGSEALISIAIAALLVSCNTWKHEFVWDDRAAVIGNRDVQDGPLHEVFLHDFWGADIRQAESHKSYRPLTILTFRWNNWLHGLDPGSFHVYNTLLHVLCSGLVYLTTHEIAQPYRMQSEIANQAAWLAGMLFAVHPVHCDAVTSVVGRADLLCATFSLLAFLVYARAIQETSRAFWRHFIVSILLVIAACLSKELGFTTFGLMLMYDVVQLSAFERSTKTTQMGLRRLGCLTLCAVLISVGRVWINGRHVQHHWSKQANNIFDEPDRLTRMYSYAHLHAWYLWKLLWPEWLSFDYGFNTIPLIRTISDPRNLLTAAAYMLVLSVTLYGYFRRRESPLFLCICFGVIPFIPASNMFFPVGTVVAERLLYYPSVGFCCLVGFALADVQSRAKRFENGLLKHSHAMITWSLWFILFSAALKHFVRNLDWQDEATLFGAALDVAPTNIKVLTNVGKVLLNPDPERAITYLSLATAMLVNQVEGYTNLGLAHANKGSMLHAIRNTRKAIHFGPKHFQPKGYLGDQLYDYWKALNPDQDVEKYMRSPTIRTALRALDQAIALGSFFPVHYFTRGWVALNLKRLRDAQKYFIASERANERLWGSSMDKELQLDRGVIINMQAVVAKYLGKLDESLKLTLHGMALSPYAADLPINAAIYYLEMNDTSQAQHYIDRVVQVANPKDVNLLLQASSALENMGQLQYARMLVEKVIGWGLATQELTEHHAWLLQQLQA